MSEEKKEKRKKASSVKIQKSVKNSSRTKNVKNKNGTIQTPSMLPISNQNEIQNPQGVLNHNQKVTPVPSPFRTVKISLEDIEIKTIQHFTIVRDHVEQMDSNVPYLIRTPEGDFCIDGWEMIEDAISKNLDVIRCEIEEIEKHSIEELIIRKIASRSKTKGGIAIYSEIIRYTKEAAEILMASNENLISFCHGGRRYGDGFSEERDNNVRQVLSTRLGKDRDTINTHLLHGQHLTLETLEILIEQRLKRDFFDKYQRCRKRKLQGQLEKEKLPHAEITSRISADILSFLEEYERSKNEERTGHNQSETTEQQEENDTQEDVIAAEPTDSDKDEPEDSGNAANISEQIDEPVNDEDEDDEEVTVPAIKQSVKRSAKRIEEAANEDVDANKLAELLRQEMMRLQRILNRLNVLRNESTMSRT